MENWLKKNELLSICFETGQVNGESVVLPKSQGGRIRWKCDFGSMWKSKMAFWKIVMLKSCMYEACINLESSSTCTPPYSFLFFSFLFLVCKRRCFKQPSTHIYIWYVKHHRPILMFLQNVTLFYYYYYYYYFSHTNFFV